MILTDWIPDFAGWTRKHKTREAQRANLYGWCRATPPDIEYLIGLSLSKSQKGTAAKAAYIYMEQMGIEPTTSTLRTWRSPN